MSSNKRPASVSGSDAPEKRQRPIDQSNTDGTSARGSSSATYGTAQPGVVPPWGNSGRSYSVPKGSAPSKAPLPQARRSDTHPSASNNSGRTAPSTPVSPSTPQFNSASSAGAAPSDPRRRSIPPAPPNPTDNRPPLPPKFQALKSFRDKSSNSEQNDAVATMLSPSNLPPDMIRQIKEYVKHEIKESLKAHFRDNPPVAPPNHKEESRIHSIVSDLTKDVRQVENNNKFLTDRQRDHETLVSRIPEIETRLDDLKSEMAKLEGMYTRNLKSLLDIQTSIKDIEKKHESTILTVIPQRMEAIKREVAAETEQKLNSVVGQNLLRHMDELVNPKFEATRREMEGLRQKVEDLSLSKLTQDTSISDLFEESINDKYEILKLQVEEFKTSFQQKLDEHAVNKNSAGNVSRKTIFDLQNDMKSLETRFDNFRVDYNTRMDNSLAKVDSERKDYETRLNGMVASLNEHTSRAFSERLKTFKDDFNITLSSLDRKVAFLENVILESGQQGTIEAATIEAAADRTLQDLDNQSLLADRTTRPNLYMLNEKLNRVSNEMEEFRTTAASLQALPPQLDSVVQQQARQTENALSAQLHRIITDQQDLQQEVLRLQASFNRLSDTHHPSARLTSPTGSNSALVLANSFQDLTNPTLTAENLSNKFSAVSSEVKDLSQAVKNIEHYITQYQSAIRASLAKMQAMLFAINRAAGSPIPELEFEVGGGGT